VKIEEPFDGDPPDVLVDETDQALARAQEKLKRLQAFLASRGISTVVIVSSYDPLTDMNHMGFTSRGNLYQNVGAVHKWLSDQVSN
jgi:hypothetical protein